MYCRFVHNRRASLSVPRLAIACRRLAALSGATLLGLVFAACGGDTPLAPDGAPTTPAAAAPTTAASAAPPTTVASSPPAELPAPLALLVPTGLHVSATTRDSITLRWTAVAGATYYAVQFSADTVFDHQDAIRTETQAWTRLTGLSPGSTWHVRVRAVAGTVLAPVLSAWSNYVTGMVGQLPPAPDTVAVRTALEALYNATDGPNWQDKTNWLSDLPLGLWYGVTTDGSGGVTRLDLEENGLSGQLPSALGALPNIVALDLEANQLTGPIPSELGALAALRFLGLGANLLSGGIPPSLGDLSNLETLSLAGNQLSGPIPSELGDLSNLIHLGLFMNQLSGPIPPELGALSKLEFLALHDNSGLSGPLPTTLAGLTDLELLSLGNTNLCAPADPAFQRWLAGIEAKLGILECGAFSDRDVLEELYRATGGPAGRWADTTGWLRDDVALSEWHGVTTGVDGRVTRLVLGQNGLSGSIPRSLGGLTNLAHLDLSSNRLSGAIPPELGDLPNLEHLDLSSNQLSGAIPSELGDIRTLRRLILHENQLTGPVPRDLGSLDALRWLILSNNPELSGPLPNALTRLIVLEKLSLQNTSLCAPADAAFRNWLARIGEKSGIRNCDAGICARTPEVRNGILALLPTNDCFAVSTAQLEALSGTLNLRNRGIAALKPGDFAGLAGLTRLNLEHNRLRSLPGDAFDELRSLRELRLGDNALRMLPHGVFERLGELSELSLSGNPLARIPADLLTNLDRLETLGLGRISLRSVARGAFNRLDLRVLDLSGNLLTTLPAGAFEGMGRLNSLDLTGNQLTTLPTGVFAGLDALEELYLRDNSLNELPAGVFEGLVGLHRLWLEDNPGAPFRLPLKIEQLTPCCPVITFQVEFAPGAPFPMTIVLRGRGATLSSSTVTIPAGSTQSEMFTVQLTATSWSVEALGPGLPSAAYRGFIIEDAIFEPE